MQVGIEKELVMKNAALCLMIFMAAPALARAETGGYPASPSHGVVGTKPDGTPRYGGEPADTNRSSDTVGNSNSSGDRSTPSGDDAAKQQSEPPQRGR